MIQLIFTDCGIRSRSYVAHLDLKVCSRVWRIGGGVGSWYWMYGLLCCDLSTPWLNYSRSNLKWVSCIVWHFYRKGMQKTE